MDLERIVLISIITILSTIGGVFLFNKITDTWIGLQEEAKKKEKRIEYIL